MITFAIGIALGIVLVILARAWGWRGGYEQGYADGREDATLNVATPILPWQAHPIYRVGRATHPFMGATLAAGNPGDICIVCEQRADDPCHD